MPADLDDLPSRRGRVEHRINTQVALASIPPGRAVVSRHDDGKTTGGRMNPAFDAFLFTTRAESRYHLSLASGRLARWRHHLPYCLDARQSRLVACPVATGGPLGPASATILSRANHFLRITGIGRLRMAEDERECSLSNG